MFEGAVRRCTDAVELTAQLCVPPPQILHVYCPSAGNFGRHLVYSCNWDVPVQCETGEAAVVWGVVWVTGARCSADPRSSCRVPAGLGAALPASLLLPPCHPCVMCCHPHTPSASCAQMQYLSVYSFSLLNFKIIAFCFFTKTGVYACCKLVLNPQPDCLAELQNNSPFTAMQGDRTPKVLAGRWWSDER